MASARPSDRTIAGIWHRYRENVKLTHGRHFAAAKAPGKIRLAGKAAAPAGVPPPSHTSRQNLNRGNGAQGRNRTSDTRIFSR
jgi:hypothetical protein